MKPLETNQLILMWLFAFPSDETASRWKKFAYFMFTAGVIITHFLALVAGGIFIFQFISVDMREVLYALFHTIGSFNMLYQSTVTVLLRRKLTAIFEGLSKIYNESKSPNVEFFRCIFFQTSDWNQFLNSDRSEDSFPILVETNTTCEWIWSLFIKYVMIVAQIMIIMMSIASLFISYFRNGYFAVDHAYRPFKFM